MMIKAMIGRQKRRQNKERFSLYHSESSSCWHQKWRLPLWTILFDRRAPRENLEFAVNALMCPYCATTTYYIRMANARIAGIEKQQSRSSRWSKHKHFCSLQSTSPVHIYCTQRANAYYMYSIYSTETQPFVVTASVLQNCRFYESRLSSVSARARVCMCHWLWRCHTANGSSSSICIRENLMALFVPIQRAYRAKRRVKSWRAGENGCSIARMLPLVLLPVIG